MITLTLHVDAAAAVRAGKSTAGPRRVQLDDAAIATLDEDQRDTLARHIGGEIDYRDPLTEHAPPIGIADVHAVASLLTCRAAYVADKRRAPLSAVERQRRIADAVRAVGRPDAAIVAAIHAGPPLELAAILAAARDPVIRDALAQVWQVDKLEEPTPLRCARVGAGMDPCTAITHVDRKGYVYCNACGERREASGIGCRRLTQHEIATLAAGGLIDYDRRAP